jgi:hypothetical protein
MKKIIVAMMLLTPFAAYAQGDSVAFAVIYFATFVVPITVMILIVAFLLYKFRTRSNAFLVIIEIVSAIGYAVLVNWLAVVGTYTHATILAILMVILFIAWFIRKMRGGDALLFNRFIRHGFIASILIGLSAVSLVYATVGILNASECNTNLILNSNLRGLGFGKCIDGLAVSKNDITICNRREAFLQESDKISSCIWNVAVSRGDHTTCDSLNSVIGVDYCKSKIATDKQDIEICKLISNYEGLRSCTLDISIKKGDPSVCDHLAVEDSDSCHIIHGMYEARGGKECDYLYSRVGADYDIDEIEEMLKKTVYRVSIRAVLESCEI